MEGLTDQGGDLVRRAREPMPLGQRAQDAALVGYLMEQPVAAPQPRARNLPGDEEDAGAAGVSRGQARKRVEHTGPGHDHADTFPSGGARIAIGHVGGRLLVPRHDVGDFLARLLTSNTSGPLQWILGGFYQDFNSTDDVFTNTPGPIAVEVLGVPSLHDVGNSTNYKQEAAFGEASYKLPQNLQLTAGLRYYSYHTAEELAESGGLPNGSLIPTVFNLPASNSGESPKVNLSYLPSDNLTLYMQAVKGFRPGGGNTPPPYACPSNPLQYGPDSLWSYEGGEKARLFDDRVVANSAAYYERWSGIQQSVAETCGASYTANAGTADVYGGEFELMARITDHLTLTNSAGFTHARIVQSVPGGTFYVGEQVQDVPTWTDSTSLELTHPVAEGYELVARASNVFVGSMTDVSYAINEVPSHDIVNLRLGLNLERADIDLFLDNAANTHAILGNTNALSFNVATFNRVATNQPRTVGLDINYYFGGK